MSTGHTYHLEQPPEVYFVGDNFHIVDRIGGAIVLHKIYPAAVVDRIAARAKALGKTAGRVTDRVGDVRKKKGKRCAASRSCPNFQRCSGAEVEPA